MTLIDCIKMDGWNMNVCPGTWKFSRSTSDKGNNCGKLFPGSFSAVNNQIHNSDAWVLFWLINSREWDLRYDVMQSEPWTLHVLQLYSLLWLRQILMLVRLYLRSVIGHCISFITYLLEPFCIHWTKRNVPFTHSIDFMSLV